jgi:AraC-like DNA-binding protein
MKTYQPLVLQKLDIRIPHLHVRRLAVHRHLPETTDVKPHGHSFAQCLLYLSGRGIQEIAGRTHPIETGSAVFLPPGMNHAFHREANRRPICMVLDFDWRGSGARPAQVLPVPTGRLHELRQLLARLVGLQRQPGPAPSIQMSAVILTILEHLLTATVFHEIAPSGFQSPVARKLDRLLSAPETASEPLGALASKAGYQPDYLNRLLKQHDGLTLGQLRARKRLAHAQQLLRQSGSIAEVATAVGYGDPNYFARWFRKQTGRTPSRWRTGSKH